MAEIGIPVSAMGRDRLVPTEAELLGAIEYQHLPADTARGMLEKLRHEGVAAHVVVTSLSALDCLIDEYGRPLDADQKAYLAFRLGVALASLEPEVMARLLPLSDCGFDPDRVASQVVEVCDKTYPRLLARVEEDARG